MTYPVAQLLTDSSFHPLRQGLAENAIKAALLAERGAEVVIADQSGIEHVLHHPGGVVRGSTVENFTRSGMGGKPFDCAHPAVV